MPSGYEQIRDKLIESGEYTEEEAKTSAARIWNSKHPEDPVAKNYDDKSESNRGDNKG